MNATVLVLNQDYQPLSICSVQRSMKLLFLEKAELLHDDPEKELSTPRTSYQYEIMLVLSEAVTNAMEHGNKLNANKTVKLSITMSAESTTAEVYDEGPGFNPEELVNPLGQDEMLRDHGRGWFLMQHYSSSIEWNDENKCLTIHF